MSFEKSNRECAVVKNWLCDRSSVILETNVVSSLIQAQNGIPNPIACIIQMIFDQWNTFHVMDHFCASICKHWRSLMSSDSNVITATLQTPMYRTKAACKTKFIFQSRSCSSVFHRQLASLSGCRLDTKRPVNLHYKGLMNRFWLHCWYPMMERWCSTLS